MDVMKMAIPGIFCILVMFFLHFFINLYHKIPNDKNAVISFTDTGKNFKLVIAVSAAVVGIQSSQAFVGVIGPLIKMHVFILIVRAASILKKKYYPVTSKAIPYLQVNYRISYQQTHTMLNNLTEKLIYT